jgi:site-specific recombinase XerD
MEAPIMDDRSALALREPQPLDQSPALIYLASQNSERGRKIQRQSLEIIAGLLTGSPDILSCNWPGLRKQHTAIIRTSLGEKYAPATVNRMLCALRGTLKAAWQLDLMTAEDYYKARDVGTMKGESLPAGRALAAGEISALLADCEDDPTPAGARDAALLVVMYPGGLRRAEVAGLDLADYDTETGALTVRHGKGNKARINYLSDGAQRAMLDWLKIRGAEPGPLFYPVNKGGRLQLRRMTSQAVYSILQKRGDQAGVSDFSPHDMRRTFISDLLDAGADIAIVAKMAGHTSVNTTARYDRRTEQAKQKTAGLLHVPYRGRLV